MPSHSKQILGVALLIVGLALCGFGLSLLLQPAQYAATARINVEKEPPADGPDYSYDPYFIQTEFEVLQSQLVLGIVITNLDLNEVWGRKYFHGATLKTSETMAIIKRRLNLAPVRNTRLIAITFYSEDPKEAAQVANAVAEAYRDYRVASRIKLASNGLEILQQEFQAQAQPISVLQTKVEQLRRKFGIQDLASTNQSPEQQPYWDEKRKLDQMIKLHQLLYLKLEAEKIPETLLVEITEAEPPKSPVGPNRFVGAALLALGLVSTAAGLFRLKSSRQQNA